MPKEERWDKDASRYMILISWPASPCSYAPRPLWVPEWSVLSRLAKAQCWPQQWLPTGGNLLHATACQTVPAPPQPPPQSWGMGRKAVEGRCPSYTSAALSLATAGSGGTIVELNNWNRVHWKTWPSVINTSECFSSLCGGFWVWPAYVSQLLWL